MRVLIFGATGMLGKALMRRWSGAEVVGLGSSHADIRVPEQVSSAVKQAMPDWIVLAASRSEIDVVNDQRGSPTYTLDLADAIVKLCRSDARGIIHCTNSGDCTWYEFAAQILRQAGSQTQVRPTTGERFVRPAERPRYSVLSPASLNAYGISMRNWQETLPDYLRERALSSNES